MARNYVFLNSELVGQGFSMSSVGVVFYNFSQLLAKAAVMSLFYGVIGPSSRMAYFYY